MASPSKKAAICAEKRRLFDELQRSLAALTSLQNAQSRNLIDGGAGLPRIELALQEARTNWGKTKQEYQHHLRVHGC